MSEQPTPYAPIPLTIAPGHQILDRRGFTDVRALAERGHPCHRCGVRATHQWPRHATPAEAEDWHSAREQWIRAHNDGRPEAEYVADRSDVVTMAVHGCGEHELSPGPADETNAAKWEARQIGAKLRMLTHDADCGGHGACRCGGDRDAD